MLRRSKFVPARPNVIIVGPISFLVHALKGGAAVLQSKIERTGVPLSTEGTKWGAQSRSQNLVLIAALFLESSKAVTDQR